MPRYHANKQVFVRVLESTVDVQGLRDREQVYRELHARGGTRWDGALIKTYASRAMIAKVCARHGLTVEFLED